MRIIEIQEGTTLLIRQLMELWEKSVRETHLFLPDSEIENIKEYIPQVHCNGLRSKSGHPDNCH